MIFTIFSLLIGIVLGYMAFVDYSNGKMKSAAFSGVLSVVQFVLVVLDLMSYGKV